MNFSKIEWCDYTFNPITGCYGVNGVPCPYCYARNQVRRFTPETIYDKSGIAVNWVGADEVRHIKGVLTVTEKDYPVLDEPLYYKTKQDKTKRCAYPFGFTPTLHRYRLDEPQGTKKPQNVFVCSMSDLFGDWVPNEWIKLVFEACEKAPQHRYLFLTKNPERVYRFLEYSNYKFAPNFWFGTSASTQDDFDTRISRLPVTYRTFVSVEPIMENIKIDRIIQWVIVGMETGNRKDKIIPKKAWIENIVDQCRDQKTPVFMKDSLAPIWGEPLIREYPWERGDKKWL